MVRLILSFSLIFGGAAWSRPAHPRLEKALLSKDYAEIASAIADQPQWTEDDAVLLIRAYGALGKFQLIESFFSDVTRPHLRDRSWVFEQSLYTETESFLSIAQDSIVAGDASQAELYLAQALKNEPLHPRALFLLGMLSLDQGRVPHARQFWVDAQKWRSGVPKIEYLGQATGMPSRCKQPPKKTANPKGGVRPKTSVLVRFRLLKELCR